MTQIMQADALNSSQFCARVESATDIRGIERCKEALIRIVINQSVDKRAQVIIYDIADRERTMTFFGFRLAKCMVVVLLIDGQRFVVEINGVKRKPHELADTQAHKKKNVKCCS